MKLSIITICYNEKDVEKTCKSIINQTYQDFEWVVIDGGSDLWCTEILNKYKNHMSYYISEKDNGIYDAMNKGISQAKGEYVNFMNAGDCFYEDTVLEDVFSKNNFTTDIIYGKEKRLMKDGSTTIVGKKFNFDSPNFWRYQYWLRHQASFIKRELFTKYGNYDLQYKSASDFEKFLLFLYIKKCSSSFIDRIVSIFKVFDGISSTQDIGSIECRKILKIYNIISGVNDMALHRISTSKISILKYRILSKILFGKRKKHYKAKYRAIKKYQKEVLRQEQIALIREAIQPEVSFINDRITSINDKITSVDDIISQITAKKEDRFYSQYGEDMLFEALYDLKNSKYKGFYLDIGANHPIELSNTQYLYERGWRGINIDANPGSMDSFNIYRPEDINLEIGIAEKEGILDFYALNPDVYSSFSKADADDWISRKIATLEKIVPVKTNTINAILNEYLPSGQQIDLISIDVEGFELKILEALDFNKYKPTYLIVEENEYILQDISRYNTSTVYKFLTQKGYVPVLKTVCNVIYKREID